MCAANFISVSSVDHEWMNISFNCKQPSSFKILCQRPKCWLAGICDMTYRYCTNLKRSWAQNQELKLSGRWPRACIAFEVSQNCTFGNFEWQHKVVIVCILVFWHRGSLSLVNFFETDRMSILFLTLMLLKLHETITIYINNWLDY